MEQKKQGRPKNSQSSQRPPQQKRPPQQQQKPPQRRRRKRSKWQDFKEAYLPVIILAAVIVLIIWFIAGSVSRANESKKQNDVSESSTPTYNVTTELQQEADSLMTQAAALAAGYDYQGACDVLKTFSGEMASISGMAELYSQYEAANASLVPYTNVTSVPHLSVNTLMADLSAATSDSANGNNFNRNYITTSEFSTMLQKLYDGGYVLVSMYDLVGATDNGDGTVTFAQNTLYLPAGKKPIVLTLTDANYDSAMNTGFASRLIVDANGNLACEMSSDDGTTVTGNLDFIPILSNFVASHPDFSYHGARAIIAVSGQEGLFGYDTVAEAASVIEAVKAEGYDFACYTYSGSEIGGMTATEIDSDLSKWVSEVEPALGDVDILVYPYGSDFTDDTEFTGDTYSTIASHGFRYLVGTNSKATAWGSFTDSFYLQTRRWVSGRSLTYRADYFTDLFDAASVLDANRTNVPE